MSYELHKRIKDVAFFFILCFHSVPLCILHWLSVSSRSEMFPLSWTVTPPAKPTWVFTGLCTDPLPTEYLVLSHHPPTSGPANRARFEFSLDWCKAVLRLPSHTFSSMTHSSGLLAPSAAPMCQSFISLLRTESKMPHMNCYCRHRFAQRTANNQFFIQRWLGKPFDFQQPPHWCEDFYSLPTIQPGTLCLFSFESLPTGHGNASLHPQ